MSKITNESDDLATCSADDLIKRLSPEAKESIDSSSGMWAARSASMVSAVITALVWLRDNRHLELSMDTVREHLILKNMQTLSATPGLPADVSQPLKAYLRSLPGFVEGATKQSETVTDMHGYLQMRVCRDIAR